MRVCFTRFHVLSDQAMKSRMPRAATLQLVVLGRQFSLRIASAGGLSSIKTAAFGDLDQATPSTFIKLTRRKKSSHWEPRHRSSA
ncbi:hypothetical protein Mapa_001263 [Marchantia paleacea]|nr:hypothetical protein Mapa_001263 [Marchantia paleacea]